MLSLHLKPIFIARGIDKPYAFLKKNGFSHHMASQLIGEKKAMLPIAHIERLCYLLWCEPNDLFVWKAEPDKYIPDHHPLLSLQRKEDAEVNIKKMISNVPYKDLAEISDLLKKGMEETNSPSI